MQYINGNGNIQVGGNFAPFSPDNPHAVKCPQCGTVTGRYSVHCQVCTYQVKAHFDGIELKARRSRMRGIALSFLSASFGLGYIAQHWLANTSYSLTLNVTAIGSLLVGALCLKINGDC